MAPHHQVGRVRGRLFLLHAAVATEVFHREEVLLDLLSSNIKVGIRRTQLIVIPIPRLEHHLRRLILLQRRVGVAIVHYGIVFDGGRFYPLNFYGLFCLLDLCFVCGVHEHFLLHL